jgi:predicted alpha/beta superfamily hydrolase
MSTEPVTPPDAPVLSPAMKQPSGPSSLQSRIHKHEQFASRLVDEKHDFIVYVPQAFSDDPNRFFPVLYLHDGQNLFDPETSFIKGNYWRVGETADALIAAGEVEPLVIVGIYNTGVKRIDEYTPVEDKRLGGGRADAYGQMLVEELKPFVAHQYRTLAGAENSGMGGSSLGGLVSLYLGMRYPHIFGNLAILSPSVWWHSRAILRTVDQLRQKTGQKIWLDIGTREGRRALADVRALKRLLIKKGWQKGIDLEYREIEGGKHTEYAWAERVGPMLKFLFPRR